MIYVLNSRAGLAFRESDSTPSKCRSPLARAKAAVAVANLQPTAKFWVWERYACCEGNNTGVDASLLHISLGWHFRAAATVNLDAFHALQPVVGAPPRLAVFCLPSEARVAIAACLTRERVFIR